MYYQASCRLTLVCISACFDFVVVPFFLFLLTLRPLLPLILHLLLLRRRLLLLLSCLCVSTTSRTSNPVAVGCGGAAAAKVVAALLLLRLLLPLVATVVHPFVIATHLTRRV